MTTITLSLPLPCGWTVDRVEIRDWNSPFQLVRTKNSDGRTGSVRIDTQRRACLDSPAALSPVTVATICERIANASVLQALEPESPPVAPTATPQRSAVIVTGNRAWTGRELIRTDLARFPARTKLYHGACPVGDGGADWIADEIGRELGFIVTPVPILTRLDGDMPGGGPRRNRRMVAGVVEELRLGYVEKVYGFAYAIRYKENRGTFDCSRVMKSYKDEIEFVGRWDR